MKANNVWYLVRNQTRYRPRPKRVRKSSWHFSTCGMFPSPATWSGNTGIVRPERH